MPKPDAPRNGRLAGLPAPASVLIDVPKLITAYYEDRPDPAVASQRVGFGTWGHRGSAFAARGSGTEDVYKIYAESFRSDEHLESLLHEAQAIVDDAIGTV